VNSIFFEEVCELIAEVRNFRYSLYEENSYNEIVKYIKVGSYLTPSWAEFPFSITDYETYDLRNLLLNCETIHFTETSNCRADKWMLSERLCETAQWEIRELSEMKLQALLNVSPTIYKSCIPPCVEGKCKEGKMSCKKVEQVRTKYQGMLNQITKDNFC
jgi:hypothetical protein